MAIQVSGTQVIGNSRDLTNIASVDATTVTALENAGVGASGVFSFTASGSISAGKPVILNTNGTVSQVSGNLTATNFVGMSTASYTSGQTAKITTKGGVNESQSGLTVGVPLYVQSNGTLSTSPGTPSVYAGLSLSATKILVRG